MRRHVPMKWLTLALTISLLASRAIAEAPSDGGASVSVQVADGGDTTVTLPDPPYGTAYTPVVDTDTPTGEPEGDQLRIMTGLTGNETVATSHQSDLYDGAPVTTSPLRASASPRQIEVL